MKRKKIFFTKEETDFMIDMAKKHSPDDIVKAAGIVTELHNNIADEKKWIRRNRQSIEHKLYRIMVGFEAHPDFHKTAVRFSSKKADKGKTDTNGTGPSSAWHTYQHRLKEITAKYEESKESAKHELLKAL